MQAAMGKVDGVPPQRDELGRPQPVPIRDQHHGGITVAVAILPGGRDQPGDLAVGQVLAGADLGIAFAAWRTRRSPTVPITVGGATSARCGFVMIFKASPGYDCPLYKPSRDTAQARKAPMPQGQTRFRPGGGRRPGEKP